MFFFFDVVLRADSDFVHDSPSRGNFDFRFFQFPLPGLKVVSMMIEPGTIKGNKKYKLADFYNKCNLARLAPNEPFHELSSLALDAQ